MSEIYKQSRRPHVWPNLVFVQHYCGFASFLRFRRALGPPKINKKADLKKTANKNTFVFDGMMQKTS